MLPLWSLRVCSFSVVLFTQPRPVATPATAMPRRRRNKELIPPFSARNRALWLLPCDNLALVLLCMSCAPNSVAIVIFHLHPRTWNAMGSPSYRLLPDACLPAQQGREASCYCRRRERAAPSLRGRVRLQLGQPRCLPRGGRSAEHGWQCRGNMVPCMSSEERRQGWRCSSGVTQKRWSRRLLRRCVQVVGQDVVPGRGRKQAEKHAGNP